MRDSDDDSDSAHEHAWRDSGSSVDSSPPASTSQHAGASVTSKLRDEVKKARRDAETEELLEVVAENSGWSLEDMCERPESITYIELFLLTFTRLPQLRLFPNMTSVKLMHVGLTSMQDLATLTLVEELWLSENAIKKIEGLDKMTKLRRLYLQGNEITSLDGLPPLKHLKELWLCRNQIKVVDAQRHLYNVRKLRSLWLACNPISHLEDAFRPFLSHLREISLAGCEVYCFSQIAQLRPIASSLKKLWFADPLFGENPICRLNNYTTFTVHLLGAGLEQLDHEEVTDEQRALAAAVYDKKRIYYSMRLHSLDRNCGLLAAHAQHHAQVKIDEANEATRQLSECLAPIQGAVKERQTYNDKCSSPALGALALNTLEQHERDLSRAVDTREVQIQSLSKRLAEAVSVSSGTHTLLEERLCMELHSGGNVRLDEVTGAGNSRISNNTASAGGPARSSSGDGPSSGSATASNGAASAGARGTNPRGRYGNDYSSINNNTNSEASASAAQGNTGGDGVSDGYYESAKEMLENGFAIAEDTFKEKFGIGGVEVNRVFRVVNRGLRLRFDDRLRALEVDMADPTNRRKMMCLFSPVPRDKDEQGSYLRHVLLKGVDVAGRKKKALPSTSTGTDDGEKAHQAAPQQHPPPANEGVPLTNSLFLADEERLLTCQRRGELTGFSANPNTLTGQLIVSRVFIGKSVQALGSGRSVGNAEDGTGAAGATAFISKARKVLLRDYSEDVFSVYRTPPSNASLTGGAAATTITTTTTTSSGSGGVPEVGSRVWYCLDRAIVLPEFVIDYTYTLSSTSACVVPFISATPALSLVTSGATAAALRATLAAVLPTLLPSPSEDKQSTALASAAACEWADLKLASTYLLAFVAWCQDSSTVSQFAKEETEKVIAAARKVLKDTGCRPSASSAPSPPKSPKKNGKVGAAATASNRGSPLMGPDRSTFLTAGSPLTEAVLTAYCTEVGSGNLTYCLLRNKMLMTVPKEFTTNAFASLVTLDLTCNQLTSFSWFAIAQAAPQLETLLLQHNALTVFEFHGTKLQSLAHLSIAYNALQDVEEFAVVPDCLPRLRTLHVEGNPMLNAAAVAAGSGSASSTLSVDKNKECTLLSFFANSSLETLNHIDMAGLNKQSLARWRFERTVDITDTRQVDALLREVANRAGILGDSSSSGSGSNDSSPSLPESERRLRDKKVSHASGDGVGSGDSGKTQYDMTSLDPTVIPARHFEAALRSVLQTPREKSPSTGCGSYPYNSNHSYDSSSNGGVKYGGSGKAHVDVARTRDASSLAPSSFMYNFSLMGSLAPLGQHPLLSSAVRHLSLRGHRLVDLAPVLALRSLETLDVSDNNIAQLPDFSSLRHLKILNVSFNLLASLHSLGVPPALECLCATGNQLRSVDGGLLTRLTALRELYLAHNRLTHLSEFYVLKDMAMLATIDVSGNMLQSSKPGHHGGSSANSTPVKHTRTTPTGAATTTTASAASNGSGKKDNDTRTYFIYLFRQLKVLDGVPISQAELLRARDAFAGKMSNDLLAERAPGPSSKWPLVTQLDLSQCALREVALLEPFVALEVLSLHHNVLTRIQGVAPLRCLRALDLAFNRLGSAGPMAIGEALKPLTQLTSLSLEANHISDLNAVGLQLPQLQFLNLKANELQYLDRGLHKLPQLREVILDQNKLRAFSPDCFINCKFLTDVSAEDNAIRVTDGLAKAHTLERLNLGANRLSEMQPLLSDLQYSPLQETILLGNPIARKTNYRAAVIAAAATLVLLDKKPISRDERERAENFMRQSEQCVVPANVVIDMSFVNNLASQQQLPQQNQQQVHHGNGIGVSLNQQQQQGMGGGGNGPIPTAPVSRSNTTRLHPLATKRSGGGAGGPYGRTNGLAARGPAGRY